jgi:hypothetical protein
VLSKQFFFEKKDQKTFVLLVCALGQCARQHSRVFASFFKKKCFLKDHGGLMTGPPTFPRCA